MFPIDAHEVLLPLVPQEREAVAGDGKDVEIGTVAMRLFIGAHRHLRGMRMHGALGEDEHHVRTAGAASLPGLELEAGEVGNEIGLPHVAARAHGNELAFAAGARSRTKMETKSPRPFKCTMPPLTPKRDHGAVGTSSKSTPKSSVTGTPSCAAHVA